MYFFKDKKTNFCCVQKNWIKSHTVACRGEWIVTQQQQQRLVEKISDNTIVSCRWFLRVPLGNAVFLKRRTTLSSSIMQNATYHKIGVLIPQNANFFKFTLRTHNVMFSSMNAVYKLWITQSFVPSCKTCNECFEEMIFIFDSIMKMCLSILMLIDDHQATTKEHIIMRRQQPNWELLLKMTQDQI